MGCRICGRGACCKSFHSLEEQENYDNMYGGFELKIDELNDEIKKLEEENTLYWSYLTEQQKDEIEKESEK